MKSICDLINLADDLDDMGLYEEASEIDDIIKISTSSVRINDLNLSPEELAKFKKKDPSIIQKIWRLLTQWSPENNDSAKNNSVSGIRG